MIMNLSTCFLTLTLCQLAWIVLGQQQAVLANNLPVEESNVLVDLQDPLKIAASENAFLEESGALLPGERDIRNLHGRLRRMMGMLRVTPRLPMGKDDDMMMALLNKRTRKKEPRKRNKTKRMSRISSFAAKSFGREQITQSPWRSPSTSPTETPISVIATKMQWEPPTTSPTEKQRSGTVTEIGSLTSTPTGATSPLPVLTTAPTMAPASSSDGRWDVTLDLSRVPIRYRNLFTTASRKWESVNIGDVPDAIISDRDRNSSSCHSLPDVVDDIYICAFVEAMDGPGNVLGFGGPQVVRRDSYIPIVGQMRFDVADIGNAMEPIILHEMGHAIGLVAAIWNLAGLVSSTTPPCNYAASSAASRQYQLLSKCPATTPIPIEQNFGTGTECDHWDEDCFLGELMTGFSTGNMALSTITVAGLEDLGYSVNYTAADPYSAADMGTGCRCNNRELRGSTGNVSTTIPGLIKKKKLSEQGRHNAVSYGKAYLELMKQKKASYNGDHLFVGDRFVGVVYGEDGDVFTVAVGPD